jgi:hypothetical protein
MNEEVFTGKADFRDEARLLDVHRWSEWPEVNTFIDDIYSSYFSKEEQIPKTKKNLKVLLLDLYVAWREGWKYLAMFRDSNRYKAKSRYNALKISRMIIDIVDRLEEVGLVQIHNGYFIHETGEAYVSRVEALPNLKERFVDARFPDLVITNDEKRECIILRDKNKQTVDYIDNKNVRRMRKVLSDYNSLIRNTHIDCCHLREPVIHRKDGKRVRISQANKFTTRIFNNKSWKQGGRFYGGFWQQIPSEDREYIYIDGERTVEVDYSGLHIMLLYARLKLNYSRVSPGEDPYQVHVDGLNKDEARNLGKNVLLMGVNADTEKKAFQAVRGEFNGTGIIPPTVKLTDDLLGDVLFQLKAKHPQIADQLCSGAGIDLQWIDSQITEKLIEHFTPLGVPILCVHDSYIVPHHMATGLRQEMEHAFLNVTKLMDGLADHPEMWKQASVAIKQIGYDDEYLLDVDDELSPEERENDSNIIAHRETLEIAEDRIVPEYRERYEQFKKELAAISV